jgi:5,10-methenyltetrahydrofolate synthetase
MTPDELRQWRKTQREALIERRMRLSADELDAKRQSMDRHIERAFPNLARGVVALCWPFKNEYDARYLARRLRERGATTALPVVVKPRTPLLFREWHPGTALAKGVYDIPYPTEASPEVTPDSVLLPMNGFDDAGYRLGYGGGFFDRTLAALATHPLVIGVTFELARIPTIHPQPYDIPMDFVVTERGVYRRDPERLEFLGAPPEGSGSALASPVCYASEVDPGYFGETPADDQPRKSR